MSLWKTPSSPTSERSSRSMQESDYNTNPGNRMNLRVVIRVYQEDSSLLRIGTSRRRINISLQNYIVILPAPNGSRQSQRQKSGKRSRRRTLHGRRLRATQISMMATRSWIRPILNTISPQILVHWSPSGEQNRTWLLLLGPVQCNRRPFLIAVRFRS